MGMEQHGNPNFVTLGIDQSPGNMEGKESKDSGTANSAIWASVTTAASNGSVNSMHDSFHAAWWDGADADDDANE